MAVFFGGTFLAPSYLFLFLLAAIAIFVGASMQLSNAEHVEKLRVALTTAETNLNRANPEWHRRASDKPFQDAKRKFDAIKKEYSDIPAKRTKALDQLRKEQVKLQLERFLDRYEIEYARISGIGPGRKRTLASYGIETAEDVVAHRVSAVPGFGPKMFDRLMKWRQSLEAKFVFDPTRPTDPRDIARVEHDILNLRTQTEAAAKLAFVDAVKTHVQILTVRKSMAAQIEALQNAVAQARADYECVKS